MYFRSFILVTFMGFFFVHTISAETYQPWSENVFASIAQEYGVQAEKRLHYLHKIILDNQDISVNEKLKLVNDTLNNIPWIADEQHWKEADYWASPMETLTTFGGDCEDIAIAKWVMLRHLGIPAKKLRLAYVRIAATGENHMVLAYVDRVDLPREKRMETTWILDNLNQQLLTVPERKDLLIIFATDAKGNMVVFKDTGKGRSILGVRENSKMGKLEDIKKKIKESNEKYEKLNDGRPLYPY